MPRQSIPLLTLTVIAAAAIGANRFVSHTGEVAGAGGNALGVSQDAAAQGAALAVDVLGTTLVESGGAIAAGAKIAVDADGRAVTQAEAAVSVARPAPGASAAGAGELIEVILIPN